jgi:hypothetical protein
MIYYIKRIHECPVGYIMKGLFAGYVKTSTINETTEIRGCAWIIATRRFAVVSRNEIIALHIAIINFGIIASPHNNFFLSFMLFCFYLSMGSVCVFLTQRKEKNFGKYKEIGCFFSLRTQKIQCQLS